MDPQRRPAWSPFFNAECAVAAHSRPTLNLMKAFAFTDLMEPGAPHRVMARVAVRAPADGGRDIPFGFSYRPNHNFGGEENRAFYVGVVEIPADGLHPGVARELCVTFLNGSGLGELLQVGRRWRIQEGSRWVATAEVLAILNEA